MSDDHLYIVLGMHRSGTSCLAACLEQCGVFLGDDVFRREEASEKDFHPKGTHEGQLMVDIHECVLEAHGGSWDAPPKYDPNLSKAQQSLISTRIKMIREMAEKKELQPGLKDPRILLFGEDWFELAHPFSLIGTFRHPKAVAKSLYSRNRMPAKKAMTLWLRYNKKLVELHKKFQFPLIEYDIHRQRFSYWRNVVEAAANAGLDDIPLSDALTTSAKAQFDRNGVTEDEAVPKECQTVFKYLRENAIRESSINIVRESMLLMMKALLAQHCCVDQAKDGSWRFSIRNETQTGFKSLSQAITAAYSYIT